MLLRSLDDESMQYPKSQIAYQHLHDLYHWSLRRKLDPEYFGNNDAIRDGSAKRKANERRVRWINPLEVSEITTGVF